jgi:VanZ family protein
LLVLATHWPNPWSPSKSVRYPDKLVHFAAYTVLAFLVARVIGRITFGKRNRFRSALLFSWVAVAAFGLLDETTQPLTGRDFEWLDWLADGMGAACGLALGCAWFRDRAKPIVGMHDD